MRIAFLINRAVTPVIYNHRPSCIGRIARHETNGALGEFIVVYQWHCEFRRGNIRDRVDATRRAVENNIGLCAVARCYISVRVPRAPWDTYDGNRNQIQFAERTRCAARTHARMHDFALCMRLRACRATSRFPPDDRFRAARALVSQYATAIHTARLLNPTPWS